MSKTNFHVFAFLFFFFLAVSSVSSENCLYTIVVKTGTVDDSGTDSKISCILKDAQGGSVGVSNLEQWGVMGPGHNYFENGNLETFSVQGPCLQSPVCELTLISDGSGNKPGWYVDNVQVLMSTGNIVFEVYGWLAEDEPPHSLTRTFNKCAKQI